MKLKTNFQLMRLSPILALSITMLLFSASLSAQGKKKVEDNNIPIALSFSDAKYTIVSYGTGKDERKKTIRKKIPKITITLLDPRKKITTINGYSFNKLVSTSSAIALSLKKGAALPYEFVVIAEADGYITACRSIKIESAQPYYLPIHMLSKTPASGSMTKVQNFKVDKGYTSEPVKIEGAFPGIFPGSINPPSSPLSIKIEIGTKLITSKGTIDQTITKGEISASYIILNSISAPTFPSGFYFNNSQLPDVVRPPLIDRIKSTWLAGRNKSPYLVPFCWINIEMRANAGGIKEEKIIRLGQNQNAIVDLVFRVEDASRIKKTENLEQLELWSLSEDGIWRNEGKVRVKKENGNLYSTSFLANHFSTWVLAVSEDPCPGNLVINYSSDADLTLFSQLISHPTGMVFDLTSASQNPILYNNTNSGTVEIANPPRNRNLMFVAYNENTGPGTQRAQVPIITGDCNNLGSIPLLNLATNTPIFRKEVVFLLETDPGKYAPICGYPVWFKSCDACANADDCDNDPNLFEFGGHLNSTGDVKLTQFSIPFNQPCCIRLWYGTRVNGGVIGDDWLDFLIDFSDTKPRDFIGKTKNRNVDLRLEFETHGAGEVTKYVIKIPQKASIPVTTCSL